MDTLRAIHELWPKGSTVPKFGNWDKSEDLSYSIIFDKARAEKEMFLHIPDRDALSEQSFDKSSDVEAVTKTIRSVFPDKGRLDGERFLHSPQHNNSYMHLRQNIVQNLEIPAGRAASHVSYGEIQGLRTRNFGYSGLKSSLDARIFQEQQNSSNIQPEPQNWFDVPNYNITSFQSNLPQQSRATEETTFFNVRQHVNRENTGYQRRSYAKSANIAGGFAYEANPAIVKMRSYQRGSDNSERAELQQKHFVPKFGDWESGERFTAGFNKVCIDKNTKFSLNPGVVTVSPLRADDDLYKNSVISEGSSEGSAERKKHRGWFQILCCS